VSILTDSRDCHGARPVIVEVAELEAKALELISVQPVSFPKNIVVGWAHNPLASLCGNQKEVPSKENRNIPIEIIYIFPTFNEETIEYF
jgi:hypothetical protein